MRLHIEIDDELIAEVDRLTGPRRRSAFVREAVKGALEQRRRWELIRRSRGVIASHGHDWDDDPAAWVEAQRFSDPRFRG
jgi:Arc/MetJ family transcription regulator